MDYCMPRARSVDLSVFQHVSHGVRKENITIPCTAQLMAESIYTLVGEL